MGVPNAMTRPAGRYCAGCFASMSESFSLMSHKARDARSSGCSSWRKIRLSVESGGFSPPAMATGKPRNQQGHASYSRGWPALPGLTIHAKPGTILSTEFFTAGADGNFEGTYSDTQNGGIEVSFKGGIATLVKGKLPEDGIKFKGDHHALTLESDANGKQATSFAGVRLRSGTSLGYRPVASLPASGRL